MKGGTSFRRSWRRSPGSVTLGEIVESLHGRFSANTAIDRGLVAARPGVDPGKAAFQRRFSRAW